MTAYPGRRRIPPSIPAAPGVLARAIDMLVQVEALPAHAAGALRFETRGIVLVQSRCVCWAAAPGMQQRLTELLCLEANPPLERDFFVDLFRRCKDRGTSLADGLLATGRVSPGGLWAALFSHTAEAIAHLAQSGARPDDFVPHARARYDARFMFSTGQILARLGARRAPELAASAQDVLDATLVPETSGWAFTRDGGTGVPVLVAVSGAPPLAVTEILEASLWASGVFDVTGVFESDVRIASAVWSDARCVIAWRSPDTYFAALCRSRAGAARLLVRLERALVPEVP
jgi:hypothetical protein